MASEGKTRASSNIVRTGRLKKAKEFFDAAVLIDDDAPDAAVNLYVLSGIAAADVVCCTKLGRYSVSESHADAIGLLKKADVKLEKYLLALLNIKSKVAYTHQAATAEEGKARRRSPQRGSPQSIGMTGLP